MASGDQTRIGELVDISQRAGDVGLGNLVEETRWLPAEARRLGAVAASAFGAGFGGSVWALVATDDAERLLQAWKDAYTKEFPQRAATCEFFITAPGPGVCELSEVGVSKRPAADGETGSERSSRARTS
eukprot:gb/GFBE01081044.1/.p1 GENE.gb/GFBE01081044.1/~~gb/GFBE01081044.1/.p1  ORF type:complete len:129 (+),score=17.11 gb/GFBE01081044.1/:1-387(+)